MTQTATLAVGMLIASAFGCGENATRPGDSGRDVALADARPDAPAVDSRAPDARILDAGSADLAAVDAGTAPDLGGGRDGATPPDGAARRDAGAGTDAASRDLGPAGDLYRGADGGPPTVTAPFSWDFESSCMGLAASRDWQCGTLNFKKGTGCSSSAIPPTAAHSGARAWGTVLNDCHSAQNNATSSCSNQSVKDDSILSFNVAIPSSWSSAYLTYWSWDDYFLSFDWAEIRINGAVAWQRCTGTRGSTVSWEKRTLDLSAYVGQTVTVAFHFMASSVVNYSGWTLDDISVSQN